MTPPVMHGELAAVPFKGRQDTGEVMLSAVRWDWRYPLAGFHVSELLSKRGLFVDASCIWRGARRTRRSSTSVAVLT